VNVNKQQDQKWSLLRNEVDEAIRAGLTAKEFMELHDISRDQWYKMKPKGFKWHRIQTELKVKRKPRKPPIEKSSSLPLAPDIVPMPKVTPPKPEEKAAKSPEPEKANEKIAVVVCKSSELKGLLTSLLD
jgi:hypothetical protein